jgi:hypothetical protein
LSRLTQTHIKASSPLTNNPSTFAINTTLTSNPITFPVDQPLYVDATHDTVIVHILTALNLTILGKEGPLKVDKLKRGRKWQVSKIVPFASNVHFQCELMTEPSFNPT